MEMQQPDEPLDEEEFDMAAMRPAMLLGLPYNLSACLLFVGVMFVLVWHMGSEITDMIADVIALSGIAMLWSAAKIMLRIDYHGWDNFLAWMRLDCWCLDTREWGGARVASFPLRSVYRAEALGHVD
jgi:type IV secretory pathway VirB3-like protein